MQQGYEMRIIDGKKYHERLSTGELCENIQMDVPVGTILYTPEQQEAYRKRKEAQKEAEQKQQDYQLRIAQRRSSGNGGQYFFVRSDHSFDDLPPATVAKLIYLLSYMGYDSRLMNTKRTPMKRCDLTNVLNISQATVTRFLSEVCPHYITVNEDKTLTANSRLFFRGSFNNERKGDNFQRFFKAGVRRLYKMTPSSQHKQLGYVYQMLPFINREYNILCRNPDVEAIDEIDYMSDAEFCERIGYSYENAHRLMRTYKKIRFKVGNHTELFMSHANGKFFVNPNILYIGSHFKQVKILGFFCNGSKRKPHS